MRKFALACLAMVPLVGCATTPAPGSPEFAYCERMERQMGLNHTHDHNEAKGMGMNPMNVTHDRCRHMLGMDRAS